MVSEAAGDSRLRTAGGAEQQAKSLGTVKSQAKLVPKLEAKGRPKAEKKIDEEDG
jgi:hypothetical protein